MPKPLNAKSNLLFRNSAADFCGGKMVVQVGRGRHFVSDLEVYVSASDIPIEIKLITFTKKSKAGNIF